MPVENPYYNSMYAEAAKNLASALAGDPEKMGKAAYMEAQQRLANLKGDRQSLENDALTSGLEAAFTAGGSSPDSWAAAMPQVLAASARAGVDPGKYTAPIWAIQGTSQSGDSPTEALTRAAIIGQGKSPSLDFAPSSSRADVIRASKPSRAAAGGKAGKVKVLNIKDVNQTLLNALSGVNGLTFEGKYSRPELTGEADTYLHEAGLYEPMRQLVVDTLRQTNGDQEAARQAVLGKMQELGVTEFAPEHKTGTNWFGMGGTKHPAALSSSDQQAIDLNALLEAFGAPQGGAGADVPFSPPVNQERGRAVVDPSGFAPLSMQELQGAFTPAAPNPGLPPPPSNYGNRADGTPKGNGFLGALKNSNGDVSTELSIGVNIDGKEVEIPSLVPTLTPDEVQWMLDNKPPTQTIVQKASEYARQRILQGKSPFADNSESPSSISPSSIPVTDETIQAALEAIDPVLKRNLAQRVLLDPTHRALYRMDQYGAGLASMLGLGKFANTAGRIAADEAALSKIPYSLQTAALGKELQSASNLPLKKAIPSVLKSLATNPEGTGTLLAESLPASLPGIALGAIAPEGNALMRGLGFGAGSAMVEAGSTPIDLMNKYGIDVRDKSAIEKALNSPEFMAEARQRGWTRAGIIGTVDALSAGAAGKISPKVAAKLGGGALAHILGAGAEVTAQGASGAVGEAGGQLAVDKRISSPSDVVMEALAELFTGIPEIAMAGKEGGRARVPKLGAPPEMTQEDRLAAVRAALDVQHPDNGQPFAPEISAPVPAPAPVPSPVAPPQQETVVEAAPVPASAAVEKVAATPATAGVSPSRPYQSLDDREEAISRLLTQAQDLGIGQYAEAPIRDAVEYGAPENEIADLMRSSPDKIDALNAIEDTGSRYAEVAGGKKQGFGIGSPLIAPPVAPSVSGESRIAVKSVDVKGQGSAAQYLVQSDDGRAGWVSKTAIDGNSSVPQAMFDAAAVKYKRSLKPPTAAELAAREKNKKNLKRVPQSLSGLIRSLGGIRDDSGDLTSQDSKLVNSKGISPDEALGIAIERGYFPQPDPTKPTDISISDLYAALDDEARGVMHYAEKDMSVAVDEAAANRYRGGADEENYHIENARAEFSKEFPDWGKLSDQEAWDYHNAMQDGVDPIDAATAILDRRVDHDLSKTTQPAMEDQYDFTPPYQPERPASEIENPAGADESAGTNDRSPQRGNNGSGAGDLGQEDQGVQAPDRVTPSPRSIDKTAVGDQTVIPGAERISDKALAERKMAEPMRAKVDQKKANEGIFDLEGQRQKDILFQPDYGMQHRPPSPDGGAPAHDVTKGGEIYPDDFYSSKGLNYYGTGDTAADKQSYDILKKLKGKPDATVMIYRAIPKSEKADKINSGDWVTLSKIYAENHGEHSLDGNYKLLSKEVKANEIFTNGDSLNEFGYWENGQETAQSQNTFDEELQGTTPYAEATITVDGKERPTVSNKGRGLSGEKSALPSVDYRHGSISEDGRTLEDFSINNKPSFRRQMYEAMGLDPEAAVNMAPRAVIEKAKPLFLSRFNIDIEVDPRASFGKAVDNLLDAWVSFHFLARTFSLPPKALGLERLHVDASGNVAPTRLKLVFSKDGRGALGSYDKASQTITIPDRSNSFVHEWFHHLDYTILRAMGKTEDGAGKAFRGYTARVRKEGDLYTPGSVSDAMINVMNAAFFDEAYPALKIMELEEKIARTKSEKVKAEAVAQIEKIKSGNFQGKSGRSEYYKGAKRLPTRSDKSYWTRPTEILARAGEAYAAYRLDMQGGTTDMLAKTNEAYTDTADHRIRDMYPHDQDRRNIFLALDQLLGAVRQASIFGIGDLENITEFPAADVKHWEFMPIADAPPSVVARVKEAFSAEVREAKKQQREFEKAAKESRPKGEKSFLRGLNESRLRMTSAVNAQVRMLMARNPQSPSMKRMGQMISKRYGSGEKRPATFRDRLELFTDKYNNIHVDIERTFRISQKNLSEQVALGQVLQGIPVTVNVKPERLKALTSAAAAMREQIYKPLYYAMSKRGIDIGYVRDVGYMSQIFDKAIISDDKEKSLNLFTEAYDIALQNEYEGDFDVADFVAAAESVPSLRSDSRLKEIKNLMEDEETAGDARDIARDMVDDLAAALAPIKADRLIEALLGVETDFDFTSGTGLKKNRSFPAATIPILAPLRIQSAREATASYIHAASKSMAIAELLPPTKQKTSIAVLKDMANESWKNEGASEQDAKLLHDIILEMFGKHGNQLETTEAAKIRRLFSTILSLNLLQRSFFPSTSESGVMGMQTGRVSNTFRSLYETVKAIAGAEDQKDTIRQLRYMGVLQDALAASAATDHFADTLQSDVRTDKMSATFFENILLSGLTRKQEIGSAITGAAHFHYLADSILDPSTKPVTRQRHIDEMHDHAIQDPVAFSTYIKSLDKLVPTMDDDSPMADQFANALKSLVRAAIQKPSPESRPLAAKHRSSMFAILGFNFSYFEHVNKALPAFWSAEVRRNGGDYTAATAQAILRYSLPYLGLLSLTSTAFLFRTMFFNHDRFDEKELKDKFLYILGGGFAYTSPVGAVGDVLWQSLVGLKYEKDLTSLTAGAGVGAFLQDLQTISHLWGRNAEGTRAVERNAFAAFYHLTVGTLATIATATVPGALGKVVGGASMFVGSRQMGKDLAERYIGYSEKEKKKMERDQNKKALEKK